MSASERTFWEQVIQRWVGQPGLLVVVVPEDFNQFETARMLRDWACRFSNSDRFASLAVPDPKDTYCYDARDAGQLISVPGPQVLPFVLAESERLSSARQAANGDVPFFLIVSGLLIGHQAAIDEWIRTVLEGWPGQRSALRTGRLHICCLVTAPLPKRQALLPEGCDRLVIPDVQDDEIAAISADSIAEYWRPDGEVTCRYVRSAVVDMASGRRTHAELALSELIADWQHRPDRRTDWVPHWPMDSEAVQQARSILQQEGITTPWLAGTAVSADSQPTRADRLWAWGLWRRGSGPGEVTQGLTTLARIAMPSPNYPESVAPPNSPLAADAAMFVFRQTVQIEQLLKDWLRRQLQSDPTRDRIRALLDGPSPLKQEQTLRDHISEQISEWQRKLSPEQLRQDHVTVSICSFGVLRSMILELVSQKQADRLRNPLNAILAARNLAAHGGWFTLNEYRDICEQTNRVVAALSSLRIGP